MADSLERELRQLGAGRPLPPALYSRLEAALVEDADVRHGGDDDVATELAATRDVPRPVPPATRAALEHALVRDTRRWSRVVLGAAAAVLLVVGSVAVLRSGGSSPNRNVAAGPPRSVPVAGVPPVLEAPSTLPHSVSAAASPATTPTTRRTPPTTAPWNCGLCAQNGYKGSANPPPPPTTAGGTWQPSGPGAPVEGVAAALPAQLTVDPSSGPRRGGTIVTLTGQGFTGANGVRFGSTSAVDFTVVSDTEIRVQAPPSPSAQKVTVSVTYADGSATPTSDSGPFFTYT